MREEETASRAEIVEEEQLLVLANFTVIALSSLSEEDFVICELLLVGERDTVDAL